MTSFILAAIAVAILVPIAAVVLHRRGLPFGFFELLCIVGGCTIGATIGEIVT